MLAALMGAIFVFLAVTGCAALRRPAPPEQVPGAPPGARQTLPNDPREASRLADRLAKVAAETPGVNRATVVLTGTTAYVGVNLEAEMEKERTEATKREVAKRVKDAEPRVERVMVTTDTDTVTRLKNIAEGVRRGEPVSAFADELKEINRRATPITE
jgi:YhcN/YlaJ family sporulation lipoprotein